MESVNPADRSFAYGYSQAQEVHRFQEEILERNTKEAAEKEAPPPALETEKMRVYRSFRFATLYDSNIFYNHNDPKDDLLYLYTPSIGFKLGRPGVTRGYLKTFYDLTYVNYSENSKLSRFNQTHTVDMGFRGGKFDFHLYNKFQPASARDTGERTELSGANGSRVITYSDNASASATYHWTPKLDLTGEYTYDLFYLPAASNKNNRSVTQFSYQQHGISPRISYKLNPKNTVYLRGQVAASDYFEKGSFSSKYYLAASGIEHRLSPKTDLSLEAGYDLRDYNLPVFSSAEGPRFSGIVRHEFSSRWTGFLSASQSAGEALNYTEQTAQATSFKTTSRNYRADLEWRMTASMLLDGYTELQTESRDGFYHFADPENASVTDTRSLEEQIYHWGLSWSWRPKTAWTYFLSYESLDKFSSFKGLEYNDRRVAGSARMSF